MNRRPIYLDYAATTPIDPRVSATMAAFLDADINFGNPSSTHFYGRKARQAVETARDQVAGLINAQPAEIIWTSGATEANNLAIKGVAYAYQRRGKHIITSQIEHTSVLQPCEQLTQQGFEVTYIKPQANGIIDPAQVQAAIRPDTILLSIMHVNNETGIIQDIRKLGELSRERKLFFHCDAAQSAGKITIDLQTMPVDLLSLSAHKLYGPKGVGALFVRANHPRLEPLIVGGGQENNLRAGTLATHQIAGMGAAFHIASLDMEQESHRIRALRQRLWKGLDGFDEIYLNTDLQQGVPGILNISFGGVEGETLLAALTDIAVSSGSACMALSMEPSHVLSAMGRSQELAFSAIRFSLGRYTSEEEIDYAVQHVRGVIERLRKHSAMNMSSI